MNVYSVLDLNCAINFFCSDVDIITHEQQVFGKQRSPVPTDSAGLTSASMLEGAFNTTTAASPTLRPMSSRSSARPPTAAERKQYAQGANKDSGKYSISDSVTTYYDHAFRHVRCWYTCTVEYW